MEGLDTKTLHPRFGQCAGREGWVILGLGRRHRLEVVFEQFPADKMLQLISLTHTRRRRLGAGYVGREEQMLRQLRLSPCCCLYISGDRQAGGCVEALLDLIDIVSFLDGGKGDGQTKRRQAGPPPRPAPKANTTDRSLVRSSRVVGLYL